MFDIGRMCIKIAGRDAGKKCVIIDVLDKSHVVVDGETRRRKCNIKHLEPLNQAITVTKNAPRTEITRLFKEQGIELKDSKPKKKEHERPRREKKRKEKPQVQPVKKTKTKPASIEKNQEASVN